jgi:DNA polymerase elongation subunit (family B)
VLTIRPDTDPKHTLPTHLSIQSGDLSWEMSLDNPLDFLQRFQNVLQERDPDILLAWYGDSWLFPFLTETAVRAGVDFNPNRDTHQQALIKQAQTYHSYGDVHFRAAETHLFGRWHIDPMNSMMASGLDFDLHAAIEMARVTCVSVQRAARNSPGAGFTAMQIREAFRRGVLVPVNKRQTERFKSAMDLNLADSGGLSYRPVVGLHWDVAELDFFSMYPSIMAAWNISGETVGLAGKETRYVPFTNVPITQDEPGLVAAVLKPLLAKRRQVKQLIKRLSPDAPERRVLKAMADGLKWLGYVSFGYQGFKNNLFGKIQAHEAITTIGQEVLTLAKEIAEELGFDVLGANTDSLFVQKLGARQPEDFNTLISGIEAHTGLVIELEGIFQWLAFLPSVTNPLVGVPNRYFGKFYDSSLKVRGTAQRRTDTPMWIADAEREVLKLLATAKDETQLEALIPEVITFIKKCFRELDEGIVPLEHLVVRKKLTRDPGEYRSPSEAAKAVLQLKETGKSYQAGQRVPFIYTHGSKSEIIAWDQFQSTDHSKMNRSRYKELMLRAVYQLLQPMGMSEDILGDLVFDGARQLSLWPDELDDFTLADELFAPYLILRPGKK